MERQETDCELNPLTKERPEQNGDENIDMGKRESLINEKNIKLIEGYKVKINGYIEGFSLHGLTRVFKAPRIECLFWSAALICSTMISAYVIHGLIRKYYKREVYTEIKSVLTDKNYFPSITICDSNSLKENYFAFCGYPVRNNNSHIPKEALNNSCVHSSIYRALPIAPSHNNNSSFWTNGVFNVTGCSMWDGDSCLRNGGKNFISRHELNHSCMTWNFDGTMFDKVYGHAIIEFWFKNSEQIGSHNIIVIPHASGITEIDLIKQVELQPFKKYTITIGKTKIIRQPAPFPSNCIQNSSLDILPGIYARRTCIESRIFLNTFKECGDITDYMRQHVLKYLSKEEKEKYTKGKKKTVAEMQACILEKAKSQRPPIELCPFPCEELELSTMASYTSLEKLWHHRYQHEGKDNSSSLFFHLEIQLQNADSYKIMEEKPIYPWDQMACEIGGFLGLVMGASMLSLIEIIACLYFYIIKKLKTSYKGYRAIKACCHKN